MKMTEYIVCFNCLKNPTWQYTGKNHFACDSCLSSEPCDCNYKLKKASNHNLMKMVMRIILLEIMKTSEMKMVA
jgi:hypothetical protein